jgi:hypothetical protein
MNADAAPRDGPLFAKGDTHRSLGQRPRDALAGLYETIYEDDARYFMARSLTKACSTP